MKVKHEDKDCKATPAEKPVSLSPLSFEEAVKELLSITGRKKKEGENGKGE